MKVLGTPDFTLANSKFGCAATDAAKAAQFGASSLKLDSTHDALQIRFSGAQAIDERALLADIRKRGVIVAGGGGTMGADIATTTLNGNIPVGISDISDAALDGGEGKINASLAGAVQRGLLTVAEAEKRAKLLTGKYTDPSQVPADKAPAFVIEAVFENYDVKNKIFKGMNQHLPADTILATNTSSLDVERLAEASGRPDRFIGLHFFLPAHKNRLVEIIPASKTSPETIAKTRAFVQAIGKIPIVCQNSPGFGVNRMLVPVMNEGIKMWERLVAEQQAQYAKVHGSAPNAEVNKLIERRMATTVERAVQEVLWPQVSKDPAAGAFLIGPFSGLNSPIYMGIIGEITESLQAGLGEGYAPAKTVSEKSKAFFALNRRAPDFNEQFAKLQYAMGGPESVDQNMLPKLKELLQGLIIGTAMQLQDQGVITPEDLQRGVGIGTKWEMMPFDLMNQLGTKRSLELVEAYAATNPEFSVSSKLKDLAASNAKLPLNYVETRKEGDAQYITINKPHRNNALDQEMLANIRKAYEAAEKDPSVKTIIFESIGGAHFVSGADIFALKDQQKGMNPVQQMALFRNLILQGNQLYNDIASSSKVTVAKVNGTALGGGTELTLACDYVVASEDATFGTPEVRYGIYPAWGGTERLPQKVGKTMARFMVLEGGVMEKGAGPAILNGKEAALIGLADKVVSSDELDSAVRDGLAQGDFTQKPVRDAQAAEERVIKALNAQEPYHQPFQPNKLGGKFSRYKVASIDDLMGQELASLAPPSQRKVMKKVLQLAESRLKHADSKIGARARLERDILRMCLNYQAVSKSSKG